VRRIRNIMLLILPFVALCLHGCANRILLAGPQATDTSNRWYSTHAERNQKKYMRYQQCRRADIAHLKRSYLATKYHFLDREETDLLTRVHHLGVRVIHENVRLRLVMPNNANFKPRSSTVNPALMHILDRVAHVLMLNKQTLAVVHGFSDSRGSTKANMALAERRAHAVIAYLESQGVPSFRLITKGHGNNHPRAGNGNERGRHLNRRVEITIHKGCNEGDNFYPSR
jgi:outer membrane protein OmpA-like peptidoglycan-associated protein